MNLARNYFGTSLSLQAQVEILENEKKALEFEKTELIKERDGLKSKVEALKDTEFAATIIIKNLERENGTLKTTEISDYLKIISDLKIENEAYRLEIARRDEIRRRGIKAEGLTVSPYEQGLNE